MAISGKMSASSLNIVVYTNADWEHALAVLRYRAPIEALGWNVIPGRDGDTWHPERVEQADIVLVQRGFPAEVDAFSEVLRLAREQNKPIVYEIDDWVWGLPEDHPAYPLHIEQFVAVLLGVYEADMILVSSAELKRLFSPFHPKICTVPNGLPDSLWQLREPPEADADAPVTIGYMGTATHLADLESIAPALLTVLEARENVSLRIWGCPLPDILRSHPRVESVSTEITSYRQFAAYFSEQQADFWIAPLLDNEFNRAKSPIKFWEYTATGAPGVYQNIPPYTEIVVNDQNGLLASTPDDWVTACLHLIDHPQERYRMAMRAHETLKSQGMLSSLIPIWEQCFRQSLQLAGSQRRELPPAHETLHQVMYRLQKRAQQRHLDTVNLLERLDTLIARVQTLSTENSRLQQELGAILASRSWRFMRKVQRFREFLIPPGSRREQILRVMWRVLRAWRRDGTRTSVQRGISLLRERWHHWYFRILDRIRGDDLIWLLQADRPRLSPPERTASVDVIVCVHNAYDDVRRCLESVVRYSSPPYNIILVDDGSQPQTSNYLQQFAADQGVRLLRNEQARGYTLAANQGLQASTADYALLLNSDTIATPGWLNGMVACAESDSRIGLVGPLSNTASWQSVPQLFNDQGDWADNALPEDVSVVEMAERIREMSERLYPRIPFLNGFCLMIKRAVLDEVGYFDEDTFGAGYGEENDFCIRARKAGWDLAVADD
ncbi:MAG TPA: glycosyltransferase, partial [Anaerolineales bacterium]|nr:glycosyltransferase [Anaerolineales bacterium]